MVQCICLNFEMYLSQFWNVFVSIFKCICLNLEIYLSQVVWYKKIMFHIWLLHAIVSARKCLSTLSQISNLLSLVSMDWVGQAALLRFAKSSVDILLKQMVLVHTPETYFLQQPPTTSSGPPPFTCIVIGSTTTLGWGAHECYRLLAKTEFCQKLVQNL